MATNRSRGTLFAIYLTVVSGCLLGARSCSPCESGDTAEHLALTSHPVLVVDTSDWDDAELLADNIAEALRHR